MRGKGGGGTSAPHPFGRQTSVEIGLDRAYVATGDQIEIREFSLEGRILRILRGSTDDPLFGASLISRYLDDEPASFAANLIRSADEMGLELPKALPAVTELLLNPEGYVWAKRFKHPFDESERWAVFSPDGAFLGHVTMPPGFSVHEIGATHVLGVSLGDLNVERVARYRLVRGK